MDFNGHVWRDADSSAASLRSPAMSNMRITATTSNGWDGEQRTNYPSRNSRTGKEEGDTPVPLLAAAGTLALSFNVDWCQPFKHARASVSDSKQ
jgi:hypothetical protein